jgi:hypothetical protein
MRMTRIVCARPDVRDDVVAGGLRDGTQTGAGNDHLGGHDRCATINLGDTAAHRGRALCGKRARHRHASHEKDYTYPA